MVPEGAGPRIPEAAAPVAGSGDVVPPLAAGVDVDVAPALGFAPTLATLPATP